MAVKVVCIGEVLWDALPQGMFLGGAPLNVAVNLKNLGIDTAMISAVGKDDLGDKALNEIQKRGVIIDSIQRNRRETGLVEVKLSERGIPSYVIHEQRAWDFIEADERAQKTVQQADWLVFGSLSFRNAYSATSIQKLLANFSGKRVFDVNFRKPFYSSALIEQLFGYTDVLKVNDEEIEEIASWFGLDVPYQTSIPVLCKRFGIESAIVTLGEEGSAYFVDGAFYHHSRFEVDVIDTVGAGDAFLSGVIYSIIKNYSPEQIVTFANAMGAFVAGSEGATPSLSEQIVLERFDL